MLERQKAISSRSCGRGIKAFTLVELLVVVSIIALLIAILLPSLSKARKQAKLVVCSTNLKQVGTGVMTYCSEYEGRLPGPLHPAIYRNQDLKSYEDHGYSLATAKVAQRRQLTWLLRTTFNDKSSVGGGISDKVTTCPTLAGIVPDSHFDRFEEVAGYYVFPTHYVINNVSRDEIDAGGGSSATDNQRETAIANYWGLSPYPGAPFDATPPHSLAEIKRASDEWAIADAWYRPRTNAGLPFLQQEGPYQWEYSGLPLPNFAPHMRRGSSSYNYVSETQRSNEDSKLRSSKADGVTPTVFFDGHATPVKSKTAKIAGSPVLYGFPGTVNPYFDPSKKDYYEALWDRIVWE